MNRFEEIQSRYKDPKTAGKYDASRYGDLQGQLNNRAVWHALRRCLAEVPRGGRILDIPCGTGRFSWHMARAGFRTVACDISAEMLAVARKAGSPKAVSPEFMEADMFNLPFADSSFDAVVCVRFMNLVSREHRILAVKKLARVAPRLIVAYYHPYTLKYLSRTLRHKLGLRHAPTERMTRKQLAAEIAETGCEIRKWVTVAPALSEEWILLLERDRSAA